MCRIRYVDKQRTMSSGDGRSSSSTGGGGGGGGGVGGGDGSDLATVMVVAIVGWAGGNQSALTTIECDDLPWPPPSSPPPQPDSLDAVHSTSCCCVLYTLEASPLSPALLYSDAFRACACAVATVVATDVQAGTEVAGPPTRWLMESA